MFQGFLPLREALVAFFNKMCTLTSRKYVGEQIIMMSNWPKIFHTFLRDFLHLRKPLMVTCNETRAPIFKKICS